MPDTILVGVGGRYHIDHDPNVTFLSVSAYKTPDGKVGGLVVVNSNEEVLHTLPVSLDVDPDGKATLKTRSQPFKMFSAAGAQYGCHAELEIADDGNHGLVGFKIVKDSDGSVAYQSTEGGAYALLPLEYGGVHVASA